MYESSLQEVGIPLCAHINSVLSIMVHHKKTFLQVRCTFWTLDLQFLAGPVFLSFPIHTELLSLLQLGP